MLKKLNRSETVVTHVYKELRRAILQNKIKAGERLIETELADKLGVSRTPVREAISKLEAEGLVNRWESGGVVVGDTKTEITEIYRLRQLLEGFAARLICERASQQEIDRLANIYEQANSLIDSASVEERSEMDRKFHLYMASISHSKRLQRIIEEYYEYSYFDLASNPYNPELLHSVHKQHWNITQALQARNPDQAEQAVHEHLNTVLELLQTSSAHFQKQSEESKN